jgi:Amidase
MNGSSLVVAVMLFALSAASRAPCHAQGRNDAFQPMETTIEDIHTAFKSGLTARRLVQAYLDRIAAYDKQGPTINSIITLNDHALEDADRLDAAYKASGPIGPLHGIPVLVKDEIDTAGMPTTLGTQVFKDYRPPRDSFAIEKLRKAGAIILGKTDHQSNSTTNLLAKAPSIWSFPVSPGARRRFFLSRSTLHMAGTM